jgi:G:T-mismatch repair DNA endonuclease (very short patch repair protein)
VQRLIELKWRVLIIWECEIKKWNTALEGKIINFLKLKHGPFVQEDSYDDSQEIFHIAAESGVDYLVENI